MSVNIEKNTTVLSAQGISIMQKSHLLQEKIHVLRCLIWAVNLVGLRNAKGSVKYTIGHVCDVASRDS